MVIPVCESNPGVRHLSVSHQEAFSLAMVHIARHDLNIAIKFLVMMLMSYSIAPRVIQRAIAIAISKTDSKPMAD
jgi:hypothetical protein